MSSRDVPNGTLLVFDLNIFYIAIKITNDCWMYALNNRVHVVELLYENIDDVYVFVVDADRDTMCGEFVRKAVTKVG